MQLEKKPKAPAKAKVSQPKTKAAAAAKPGGKAAKRTAPQQPATHAAVATEEAMPAAGKMASGQAAAPMAPIDAQAPKAIAAAERSEAKPAKAKAATPSTAPAKAVATPKKAPLAKATPSKAAAAKVASTPSKGNAAKVKVKRTPSQRIGVVLPTPEGGAAPLGTPPRLPANEELFVRYRQEGDQDVIGPEGERCLTCLCQNPVWGCEMAPTACRTCWARCMLQRLSASALILCECAMLCYRPLFAVCLQAMCRMMPS